MKRIMKKFFLFMLAAVLMLTSVSLTAFADEDDAMNYNLIVAPGTVTVKKQDVYIGLKHFVGESINDIDLSEIDPNIDGINIELVDPEVTFAPGTDEIVPGTYYYSIKVSGDGLANYNIYVIGTGAITIT